MLPSPWESMFQTIEFLSLLLLRMNEYMDLGTIHRRMLIHSIEQLHVYVLLYRIREIFEPQIYGNIRGVISVCLITLFS